MLFHYCCLLHYADIIFITPLLRLLIITLPLLSIRHAIGHLRWATHIIGWLLFAHVSFTTDASHYALPLLRWYISHLDYFRFSLLRHIITPFRCHYFMSAIYYWYYWCRRYYAIIAIDERCRFPPLRSWWWHSDYITPFIDYAATDADYYYLAIFAAGCHISPCWLLWADTPPMFTLPLFRLLPYAMPNSFLSFTLIRWCYDYAVTIIY